jgi:inner membrane protein
MMARSHVMIALAAWAATARELHVPLLDPIDLALVVAGSLLPDIDHPKSWIGRRTRPISTAIASALGHRGITHSAFAVAALTMLPLHAGYRRAGVSALAIGYLSHLAADTLTPRGLRLTWPLRGTWGIPLCRTGSDMESVIVTVVIGGIAWWTLRHHIAGMAAWPG